MNKLEYIFKKARINDPLFMFRLSHLGDIAEAKPLLDMLHKAETEEIEFPQGLTEEEFNYHIDYVWAVHWVQRESLLYRLSGVMINDESRAAELLWYYYNNDIEEFREKLDYTLTHKEDLIILSDDIPDGRKFTKEELWKPRKDFKMPPLPTLPPIE